MFTNLFRTRRNEKPGRKPWRPALEALETRLAPANYGWVTNVNGVHNFDDAANWRDQFNNPGVPGPADTANAQVNADVTIVVRRPETILSGRLNERTRILAGGSLTFTAGNSNLVAPLNLESGGALLVRNSNTILEVGSDGGSTYEGLLNVDAGAELYFGGTFASHILRAGLTFGPGTGLYSRTGYNTMGFIVDAPLTFPANFQIGNGTMTLNADVTTGQNFTHFLNSSGGTITGPGKITVPVGSTYTWTGGVLSGTGRLDILPGGTWHITGTGGGRNLHDRTVNNAGTIRWTGTGNLGGSNASLNNLVGGVVNLESDQVWNSGDTAIFTNAGTVNKSSTLPPGTARTILAVQFRNTAGTVNVNSGTLQFTRGNNASVINTAANTMVEYGGGANVADDYYYLPGATYNGPGVLRVSGEGYLAINTDLTVQNFEKAGGIGSLDGTGNLTVTNRFAWTGGQIRGGGGLTIASGASLDLSGTDGKTLSGRTLTNRGTVNWGGDSNWRVWEGAVMNNEPGGVFNALTDRQMEGGAPLFNRGLFVKSSAVSNGVTTWLNPFHNLGTLHVVSGELRLSGGGTSTGTFETAETGNLLLAGGTHSLDAGASFVGTGTARLTGATVNVIGAVEALNLALDSGTLTGPGRLTVTGTFAWTGGSMTDTNGVTAVAAGGSMVLSGNAGKTLNGRTLNLDGYTQWYNSGNISLSNATINNQANGYFEIYHLTDLVMGNSGYFNNAGLVVKVGSARTTFNVNFSNNGGYVGVYEGTLSVGGTYNQNAGWTDVYSALTAGSTGVDVRDGYFILYGQVTGHLTLSGAGSVLFGVGTITGNLTLNTNAVASLAGSVSGNLVNGGHLFVGGYGEAGQLTVGGNFTQQGLGVLYVELGGTAAGQSDQLRVIGAATLGGTLDVSLLTPFAPSAGDQFRVLQSGSRSGTFAALNLPDISPLGWELRYDANGLTLAVV